MKLMTVLGTRPELIRLSLIIAKLDKYSDHVLVHTGQNFDENLSGVFLRDLGIREPDYHLSVRGETFGQQLGQILAEGEKVLQKEKPERLLILGDTNSGLISIVARRMGISVFHLEAGNRCFDYRVPEELNRKIIDHCSTIHLPYTLRSKENLLREGIGGESIYVVGNPIFEVIDHYADKIDSQVLSRLGVDPQKYFLVTMHRAENVDHEDRLRNIVLGLNRINKNYGLPVVCSVHPRTRNKIESFSLHEEVKDLLMSEPFGFFDFIALEKNALCVITDSGTVQEECNIFGVPNLTIRDVTERPETIETGSNMLASVSPDTMMKAAEVVLGEPHEWESPAGYLDKNVSTKVVKIILGHYEDCARATK